MNVLITGGICLVGAAVGAVAGGTIGPMLNEQTDDLGFAEGLSLLFGAGVGALIGIFLGALIAAEVVL